MSRGEAKTINHENEREKQRFEGGENEDELQDLGADKARFPDEDLWDDEWDADTWFEDADADEDVEEDDEPSTQARSKWIRRTVAVLVAFALLGNVLAFWPQIYNLQAIQFIKKNRELSQNEHIQEYKQAVVVVSANERKGTGFNVDANGLVITNYHVVADERTVMVSFAQGKAYSADVVMSDANIDIAVLKVRDSETRLPTLDIAEEINWRIGAPVYVIGNPLFFHRIANEGTILGLTSLSDWDIPVLMLEAPIYKGNSGSPVIDRAGNVIAVVFATGSMKHGGRTIKVGLAIPIEYVTQYLEALIRESRVS